MARKGCTLIAAIHGGTTLEAVQGEIARAWGRGVWGLPAVTLGAPTLQMPEGVYHLSIYCEGTQAVPDYFPALSMRRLYFAWALAQLGAEGDVLQIILVENDDSDE